MKQPKRTESVLPHAHRDFSRRAFLRGMGVAMALPAMESILPPMGRAASAAAPAGAAAAAKGVATTATGAPLRTAFIYFPNGMVPRYWWPDKAGSDFKFNRTMLPLEPLKDKIQVFSGLDVIAGSAGGDGGGDHARANGTFLTGTRIKKTNGADYRAATSVDQVMAKEIGLITPFRSLELTCDVVLNVGACDTDYACVYQHNLSWSTPTQPLTPEVNPRLLFERLFGAGSPQERAKNLAIRQAQKRSILDFLNSERAAVTNGSTARDRNKLDEYFTSVRDIEQRIQAAEQSRSVRPQPNQDVPDGIPTHFGEYVQLMYDMLFLAFQTDSTRVATFMVTGCGNNREFPEIGIHDGHHTLSHHGGRAESIEKCAQIEQWYVAQLALFLDKMEKTKDIDGKSLLYNSQIVYGSGNSDGNAHNHVNLPVLLAGNAGGTLNPGRAVAHQGKPLTNLYLSMMDRVGGKTQERFGDSTGRLTDI